MTYRNSEFIKACTEQRINDPSDAQLEVFLINLYRSLTIDVSEHNCKHCIDKIAEAFQLSEDRH